MIHVLRMAIVFAVLASTAALADSSGGTFLYSRGAIYSYECTEDMASCVYVQIEDNNFGTDWNTSSGVIRFENANGSFECVSAMTPSQNWVSVNPTGAVGQFVTTNQGTDCPEAGQSILVTCNATPGKYTETSRGTTNAHTDMLSGSYNEHGDFLRVGAATCTIQAFGKTYFGNGTGNGYSSENGRATRQ